MRISNLLFFVIQVNIVFAQNNIPPRISDSLKVHTYSATNQRYTYLSSKERDVIKYINMARLYPRWFIRIAGLNNPVTRNERTLLSEMKKMNAFKIKLVPDSEMYKDAYCHATYVGSKGLVTHTRSAGCKPNYGAECIEFSNADAIQIVKNLLIDEGVESLGHRKIILYSSASRIAVSVQPHIVYGYATVVDFK